MDRHDEELESFQYEIDGVTYTLTRDKGMEDRVRQLLNTMPPVKFEPRPPSEERLRIVFEKLHTKTPEVIICPRCGSNDVWKHGIQTGSQMYLCAKCKRRFNAKGAPIKMQTPSDLIGLALDDYYGGMSLTRISRQLLSLEVGFKLFLKMYDNWFHGNQPFESSNQLEGSSPVPGLGAAPNEMEAEGHR